MKFTRKHKIDAIHNIKELTYIHYGETSATKIEYILLSNSTIGLEKATYQILPKATCNTSPHQALLLQLPDDHIILRTPPPTPKPKYILQWNKTNISTYQNILRQYLENPGEVTSAEDAIRYLTKAIQVATKAAVPHKTYKPNYKPTPFNNTILKLLNESKEVDDKWKRNYRM